MKYTRAELADDLRQLRMTEPQDKASLGKWNKEASRVREQIESAPEVILGLPDFIWHYLADADVRLDMPRYAEAQYELLEEFLALLAVGEPS